MTSLLLTGGAGFIGGTLLRWLMANTDASVTVLDSLTYAGDPDCLEGLPPERASLVVGSVTDQRLVDDLTEASDAVLHLAAESHNDRALLDPRVVVDTNVTGTLCVAQAALRHGRRLHHVSTDEVFGDLPLEGGERFTAASPYRPSSPYSASKAAADHLVRAFVRSYGLRATISVSSNNYGPRQHVEKLIPRTIAALIDGERPRLYGDGRHVRDWLHVEDHCSALWRILEAGEIGRTYLVGADGEASNRDVVATLLRIAGRDQDDVEHVADRPGHDRRYALDPTALREELGWAPRHTDLAAGLADTFHWYRAHEAWWRPARAATEAAYREQGH